MSGLLTVLEKMHAARTGYARPLRRFRHHHLVDEPLVIVPLKLAGEAAAPLGCAVGTDPDEPVLLTVPQPRNRDLQHAFFTDLAHVVLGYVAARQGETEEVVPRGGEPRLRYADAPQILVPNRPALDHLGLTGRLTRFQETEDDVPLLGRWLTFFADRAEYPGSSLALALTDLLTAQWATGQSDLEDANLAMLLAWICPPEGTTGAAAAQVAENPLDFPPAGPATDPDFDGLVLQPAVQGYDRAVDAGDPVAAARAEAKVREAVTSQLMPTWRLMWKGLRRLRELPEAAGCEQRWAADRDRFTRHVDRIAEGGPPQPRHDHAVAAAARLATLERAQSRFEAQQAVDDPFVLAELRTTGEAFGGTVVAGEPDRTEVTAKGRTVLRPRLTVRTEDPVRVDDDQAYVCPDRPKQNVRIREIAEDESGCLLVLDVVSGMGTVKKPVPIPEPGETVRYTRVPPQWGGQDFPAPEETPWTHGGPPPGSEEPQGAEQ
ncbi:hypothetical protein SAMN04489712_106133 [Thermomonospora echinospora]|uniref:Uncharacterized protein n=1 Tax=Thermomonospora echinospora TaxID=1992 RepID=A0A1H6B094_9ACTN|nr:hypothetical protein [Thermomonospora echinospora]SEG54052.1 hypothetical protein SAMN04489712_106133 [Thermomonospora echinospora]